MILLFEFTIPFSNPVLIFSLVFLIILFAPFIFRKLKIPGIIGLILAGVAVGSNGFNLLADNSSMNILGPIGLLYLMFLAGLEIDLREFNKNKNSSLVFGVMTFFIPLIIGFIVSYYLLHLNFTSALLLASMFSTQTLVSYPIASRLGILKSRAVQITIGGTIITDTAVLLLFAIIMALQNGELSVAFWVKLVVSLTAFTFAVLWILPKLSKWFLKYLEGESSSQYIYVLFIVFISALFSQMANIEPIIGAFLAGLALNRLIPHSSALMNRIVFIGNTLFIPFFLLSVGMLVNLNVLFKGTQALIVSLILVVTALVTKYLAAYTTQKIYKFSNTERNVIYGLSSSHAAATIAIILVGYKAGLLSDTVLNGTILVILFSCLVSSFYTEMYGRKLAVTETNKKTSHMDTTERILIPFSNPAISEKLIEFSVFIKDPDSKEPLFPIVVLPDNETSKQQFAHFNLMLEKALKNTSFSDERIRLHSRFDLNVANGISRAVKELMATTVVMGWTSKKTTTNYLFGSILDNLLSNTNQMVIVFKPNEPLFLIKQIYVLVPPNAELEIGFSLWIKALANFSRQINGDVFFYGNIATIDNIKSVVYKSRSMKAQYFEYDSWNNLNSLVKQIESTDILFIVSARSKTVSYNKYLTVLPRQLSRVSPHVSFALIYPEQKAIFENTSTKIDDISADPIQKSIDRIGHLGKIVRKVIVKNRKK